MKSYARYRKVEKISTFLEKSLKKMGYDFVCEFSGLSDSRYITIKNFEELTGKKSLYNDSKLKIRISDHDLPPSYDGLYGFADMDIYVDSQRMGNDGDCMDYISAIFDLAEYANKKTPLHAKKVLETEIERSKYLEQLTKNRIQREEYQKQEKKDLIEWAKINSFEDYQYIAEKQKEFELSTGKKRHSYRQKINDRIKIIRGKKGESK